MNKQTHFNDRCKHLNSLNDNIVNEVVGKEVSLLIYIIIKHTSHNKIYVIYLRATPKNVIYRTLFQELMRHRQLAGLFFTYVFQKQKASTYYCLEHSYRTEGSGTINTRVLRCLSLLQEPHYYNHNEVSCNWDGSKP